MAISQALADIYSANPSGVYYAEVISIDHSALSEPLVITNTSIEFLALVDGVARNVIPVPFTLKLPDKDTSGSQAMNIVISNLEQNMINIIERMSQYPYEPAICTYNVYIKGQAIYGVHAPQYNPSPRYDITSFSVNESTIVAVATKTNLHNRRWPKVVYTPTLFPGLDK